jgi:CRP-like cAMP-binding protein
MMILRPFRFFDQFTEGQFFALVKNLSLARFMPGDVIFRQHDPATTFSIVFNGFVRVYQQKSKVVAAHAPKYSDDVASKGPLKFVLQPGDTLGSSPFVTARAMHKFTAVSFREVVLLQISEQAFRNAVLPVLCSLPHTTLSWHPETCRGLLQTEPAQRDDKAMFLLQQMVLTALPFLAQIKEKRDETLAELCRLAKMSTVDAGTVVVREGEPQESFYLILSGRVSVHRQSADASTDDWSRSRDTDTGGGGGAGLATVAMAAAGKGAGGSSSSNPAHKRQKSGSPNVSIAQRMLSYGSLAGMLERAEATESDKERNLLHGTVVGNLGCGDSFGVDALLMSSLTGEGRPAEGVGGGGGGGDGGGVRRRGSVGVVAGVSRSKVTVVCDQNVEMMRIDATDYAALLRPKTGSLAYSVESCRRTLDLPPAARQQEHICEPSALKAVAGLLSNFIVLQSLSEEARLRLARVVTIEKVAARHQICVQGEKGVHTVLMHTVLAHTVLMHTVLTHTVLTHTVLTHTVLTHTVLTHTVLYTVHRTHTIPHCTHKERKEARSTLLCQARPQCM